MRNTKVFNHLIKYEAWCSKEGADRQLSGEQAALWSNAFKA
jgi:hypothetical protein